MGLFDPAWKGKDYAAAKKSLDKIIRKDDQEKLFCVVKEAPILEIRESAIRHLKNQTMLSEIIRNELGKVDPVNRDDVHADMIYLAVFNSHDQALMEEIIEKFKSWTGRDYSARITLILEIAIKKIQKESLSDKAVRDLFEIAQNGAPTELRWSAFQKVEDRVSLFDKESVAKCKREIYCEKLIDKMYGDEAKHDREVGCGYASRKLPDEMKHFLSVIAEDKELLIILREKLFKSQEIHNWNNCWRYHYSMLEEIQRLLKS